MNDLLNRTPPYSTSEQPVIQEFNVVKIAKATPIPVEDYDKGGIYHSDSKGVQKSEVNTVVQSTKTIVLVTNVKSSAQDFLMPYASLLQPLSNHKNYNELLKLEAVTKMDWKNYTKNSAYLLDLDVLNDSKDLASTVDWNTWVKFNKDINVAVAEPFSSVLNHTGILQRYYAINCGLAFKESGSSKEVVSSISELQEYFGSDTVSLAKREYLLQTNVETAGFIRGSSEELAAISMYLEALQVGLKNTYTVEIINCENKGVFELADWVSVANPDLCIVVTKGLEPNVYYADATTWASKQTLYNTTVEEANHLAGAIGCTAEQSNIGILQVLGNVSTVCVSTNMDSVKLIEAIKSTLR